MNTSTTVATTYPYPYYSGYTCSACGQWVMSGAIHYCTGYSPSTTLVWTPKGEEDTMDEEIELIKTFVEAFEQLGRVVEDSDTQDRIFEYLRQRFGFRIDVEGRGAF